jgi:hypothetical protein
VHPRKRSLLAERKRFAMLLFRFAAEAGDHVRRNGAVRHLGAQQIERV